MHLIIHLITSKKKKKYCFYFLYIFKRENQFVYKYNYKKKGVQGQSPWIYVCKQSNDFLNLHGSQKQEEEKNYIATYN